MFRSSSAPIVRRMAAVAGSGGMSCSRHTVFVTTTTTSSPDTGDGGGGGAMMTGSSTKTLPTTTAAGQVRHYHHPRGGRNPQRMKAKTPAETTAVSGRAAHRQASTTSSNNNNNSLNKNTAKLLPPSTTTTRSHPPHVRVREGRNSAVSTHVTGSTNSRHNRHTGSGLAGGRHNKNHKSGSGGLVNRGMDEPQHPTDFTSMALLAQRYGMIDIATSTLVYERIYGKLLGEGKGIPKAHTAENVEEIAKAAMAGNNNSSAASPRFAPSSSSSGAQLSHNSTLASSSSSPPNSSLPNSAVVRSTSSVEEHNDTGSGVPQFPADQLRSVINQEVSKTGGSSTSYPSSDGTASNAFQCLPITSRLLSVRFVSRSTASTLLPLETDNTGVNTTDPYFTVTTERRKIVGGVQRGGGKIKTNESTRTRILNVTYSDGSSVSSANGIVCQPPSRSATGNTLYQQPRFGALLSAYIPSSAKPLFFGPSPRIMIPPTTSTTDQNTSAQRSNNNFTQSSSSSLATSDTTATSSSGGGGSSSATRGGSKKGRKDTEEDSSEEKLLSLDLRDIFVDYLQDVTADDDDVLSGGFAAPHGGGGSEDPFDSDYQDDNSKKDYHRMDNSGNSGGGQHQHSSSTEMNPTRGPYREGRRASLAMQEASRIVTTLRRVVDGGVVDVGNLRALVKARTEGGTVINASVAEGAARSISVPIHTRAPLQFPLVRNTTPATDDGALGMLDTSMPTYEALQEDSLYNINSTTTTNNNNNIVENVVSDFEAFDEEVEQLVGHTTMKPVTPSPSLNTGIKDASDENTTTTATSTADKDTVQSNDAQEGVQEENVSKDDDETPSTSSTPVVSAAPATLANKNKATTITTTPTPTTTTMDSTHSMPYHQRLLARLYYGKYNSLQQRDCHPTGVDMVNSLDMTSANINAFTLQTNSTNQHQVRGQLSRHGLSGAPPISFAFGERELNGDDVEDGRRGGSDITSPSSSISSSFGSTLEVSNSLTGKALAAFSTAMLPILALQSQIDKKLNDLKSKGESSSPKTSKSSASSSNSNSPKKLVPGVDYDVESNSIPLALQRGWISEREEIVVKQQQPIVITDDDSPLVGSGLVPTTSPSPSSITSSPNSNNTTTTSALAPVTESLNSKGINNSETDYFMRLVFGDSYGNIHTHTTSNTNSTTPSSSTTLLSSTVLDRLILSSRQPLDARPESNAVYASWMRAMSFVSFHKVLENKGVRGSNALEYQTQEDDITASALDGLKKSMLDSAVTQYQFLLGRQETHERHLEHRRKLEGARKGRGAAVVNDEDVSAPQSTRRDGTTQSTNNNNNSTTTTSIKDTELPTTSNPTATTTGTTPTTTSPMSALSMWFKSILSSATPVGGMMTSTSSSGTSPFNLPSLKDMLNISSSFKITTANATDSAASSSSLVDDISTKFTGMRFVLRGEGAGGGIGMAVSGRYDTHRQQHPLPIYLPLSTGEFQAAFATSNSRLATMLNRPYTLLGADQPSTLLLSSPPQSTTTQNGSSRHNQPLLRLVHCSGPYDPHSPFGFDSLESMDTLSNLTREVGRTDSANVALGAHSRRLAIASVFGGTSGFTVSTFHKNLAKASLGGDDDLREVDFFVKRIATRQHVTDRLPHHNIFHLASTASSSSSIVGGGGVNNSKSNVGVLDRSGLSLQESQVDWLFRTSQHIHTSSTDLIQTALGKFAPSSSTTTTSSSLSRHHRRSFEELVEEEGDGTGGVAMLNVGCAGGIGDTTVLRQLVEDAVVSLNKVAASTDTDGGGEKNDSNEMAASIPEMSKKSLTVKSLPSIFQNTLKRNSVNSKTLITNQDDEDGNDATAIYSSLYSVGAVSNDMTSVVENILVTAGDDGGVGSSSSSGLATTTTATSDPASQHPILPQIIVGSYGKSPTSLKFTDQAIPLAMSLCINSGHWWKAVHVFNKIVSSGIDGRAIVGSDNTNTTTTSSTSTPQLLRFSHDGVGGISQLLTASSSSTISSDGDVSSMVLPSTMATDVTVAGTSSSDTSSSDTAASSHTSSEGVRSFDVPAASVYMLAKAVGGPIRQQWYAAEILMGIAGSRVPWRGREQMRSRFLLQILQTHVGAFKWKEGLEFIQNVGLSNILKRPNESSSESSSTQQSLQDGYPVDLAPEEVERLEAVLTVAKLLSLVPVSVFASSSQDQRYPSSTSSVRQLQSLFDVPIIEEGLVVEQQQQGSDEKILMEVSSQFSAKSPSSSELAKWMEKVRVAKLQKQGEASSNNNNSANKRDHSDGRRRRGDDDPNERRGHHHGATTTDAAKVAPCLETTLKHIEFYARPSSSSQHISSSQQQLIDEAVSRVEAIVSALRECTTSSTNHHITTTTPHHHRQLTESLMLFPTRNNHLPESPSIDLTSSSAIASPRRLLPSPNTSTSTTPSSASTIQSPQQQNHKKVATSLLTIESFSKVGDWKGVFSSIEKEVHRSGSLMDTSRAQVDCCRAEIMDVVLTIFGTLRTITFEDQQLPPTSDIIQDYSRTIAALLERFLHLEAELIKETERLNVSMLGGKEVLLPPHYILAAEIKRIRTFIETNFGTDEVTSPASKVKIPHRRKPPHPSQGWNGLVTHLLHIITLPTFGYVAREGGVVAEDAITSATIIDGEAGEATTTSDSAMMMRAVEKPVLRAVCGEISWSNTMLGCAYPLEQTLISYNTALRDSMEAATKQYHAVMSLIKSSMLHAEATRTLPTYQNMSSITSSKVDKNVNDLVSFIVPEELVHNETPEFKTTTNISGFSLWKEFLLKMERGGDDEASALSSMQEVWMWVVRTLLLPPRHNIAPSRVLALVSNTSSTSTNRNTTSISSSNSMKITPLRDVSQERQVRFLTRYIDTCISPGLRTQKDRMTDITEAVTRLVSSRISSKKEPLNQAGQLGTLLPSSNPFVMDAQTILKHVSARYLCESTIWGSPYTPPPPGVPLAQFATPHPNSPKSKKFGTGVFADFFTSLHPTLETTVDAATFVLVSLIPSITSTVLTPSLTKAQFNAAVQLGGGGIGGANQKAPAVSSVVAANPAHMWIALQRQLLQSSPRSKSTHHNTTTTWEERRELVMDIGSRSEEGGDASSAVKPYAQWGFHLEGVPVPRIETHKLALRSFAYSHLLFAPMANDNNISSDLGCVVRFYSQDVLGPLFNAITDVGIQQGFYSTTAPTTSSAPSSTQSSRALLDFAAGLCTFVGGIDTFSCSATKNNGTPQMWPSSTKYNAMSATSTGTSTSPSSTATVPLVLTANASFMQLSPMSAREAFSRLQWQFDEMTTKHQQHKQNNNNSSMRHVFQSVQRQCIATIIDSVILRIPAQLTSNAINKPYHEVKHLATSLIAQKENPDRTPRRSGELLVKHFVKYCDTQLAAAVAMTSPSSPRGHHNNKSPTAPPHPSVIAAVLTPQIATLLASQHIGHAYHAVVRSNTTFLAMAQLDGTIATSYFTLLRLISSSVASSSSAEGDVVDVLPPLGDQLPPTTLPKYSAPPPQLQSSSSSSSHDSDTTTISVVVHCSQRFWPNMGILSNSQSYQNPATHFLLPISVGPGHLPIHPESTQHPWNPPSLELLPSLAHEVNKSHWTTVCEISKKTSSSASIIPVTATGPTFGMNAPTTPLITEVLLRSPPRVLATASSSSPNPSGGNNNTSSNGIVMTRSSIEQHQSSNNNNKINHYQQELQQAFAGIVSGSQGDVLTKYVLVNSTTTPTSSSGTSSSTVAGGGNCEVVLVQHRRPRQDTHKVASVVEVVSSSLQSMWLCQFGAKNPDPFQLSILYNGGGRRNGGESSAISSKNSSNVSELVTALLAPTKESRLALHRLLEISMEQQFKIAASSSSSSTTASHPRRSILQIYSEMEVAVLKMTNLGSDATTETILNFLEMNNVQICQDDEKLKSAILLGNGSCYVRLQSQAALSKARNSLRGQTIPGATTALKTHRATIVEMNTAVVASSKSSSTDAKSYCVYMQGFPTTYTSRDVKSFITMSVAGQLTSNSRSDGRVHPKHGGTADKGEEVNRVQLDEASVVNVYLLPNQNGVFAGAVFVQVNSQKTVDVLVARNRDLAIKRFVEIKAASLETAHHILQMRNVKINTSSNAASSVLQTYKGGSSNVLTQLRDVEQGSPLHRMSVSDRKDWVHNTASQTLIEALWARLVVTENVGGDGFSNSCKVQLSKFFESISSRSPNLPEVIVNPAATSSPICVHEIALPRGSSSLSRLRDGRAVVLFKPAGVSVASIVENYHLLRGIRSASSSSSSQKRYDAPTMAPAYELPDTASGFVLCTALEAGRMAASDVSLQLDVNIAPTRSLNTHLSTTGGRSTIGTNSESMYMASTSILDAMLCRARNFTDDVWLHTKIGGGTRTTRQGGVNQTTTMDSYSAREAARICFADYLVRFYCENTSTVTPAESEETDESGGAETEFFNHFLVAQKVALYFYEWALGTAFSSSVVNATGDATVADLLNSTKPLRPTLNPSEDDSSSDRHHLHFESSIACWIDRRGFGDSAKVIFEKPTKVDDVETTVATGEPLDPALSDMLEFQRELASITSSVTTSETSSSISLDAVAEDKRALLLATLTAAFPPFIDSSWDPRSVGSARMTRQLSPSGGNNNAAQDWYFSSTGWAMRHRESFESLCGSHAVSDEHQSSTLNLMEESLAIALQAEQDNNEPVALPTLRVSATTPLSGGAATPFTTDANAINALLAKMSTLGWRLI